MRGTTTYQPFSPTSLPSRLAYDFQPPKPWTREHDLRDLFTFIWRQDAETFDHPRYRLQTALAILLIYHLGLHPNVALSEGFHYRDTKLLLKKEDNTVRVLLLICMEGRKKFPKSKYWRGRTMVLADAPGDRSMCPVTLFLALAIADGAIEGINSNDDFASLAAQNWSGCITLPYNHEMSRRSVLRRTGNKSNAISSCAMKPSALYKMMQAQMIRAGHEKTITNLVHDVKMSSLRDARHTLTSDMPLLIGRGQARSVMELLGLDVQTTTPIYPYYHMTSKLKIIPEVIEIQLRYDPTRYGIISCLYGARSIYGHGQITDMLWSFIDAASAVAPEPYYVDAVPNANGQCQHCGLRLGRIAMKTHLLRCSQKYKTHQAIKQLAISMQDQDWACKWRDCTWGSCSDPEFAAAHVSEHIGSQTLECRWNECSRALKDHLELHSHLLEDHGVHTQATIPTKARFCIECAKWILSDLDWGRHKSHHLQNPHRLYGPVAINGILAAPRRCPYCSMQGIFQQMDNHTHYIDHIERHIDTEANNNSSLKCPHQACERKSYAKSALKTHFKVFHAIPLP